MRKGLSDFEIDERAADAQTLLNHPLMEEAMMALHTAYITELLTTSIGSSEALTAQAGLQSIQRIRSYFESVVNDQKMNQKYKHRDNGHG